MYGKQKIVGDNKKGGRGFNYSCRRVSVNNHGNERTWRSVRDHIWYPEGIYSHRNIQVHNNVAGGSTSWAHGEGITQDITKVCHHEQQGEATPISSNKKGVVWPNTQRATVLQEVGKGSEAYGFQINPYNPCERKNITNKKHMTVVWHVDYFKVSHVDIFEIIKFSGCLSRIYGGLTVRHMGFRSTHTNHAK